jgi:hypothetical protein
MTVKYERVVIVQAVGFGLIVGLIWLDELLDLPHLLFGSASRGTTLRIEEAVFETVVVLVVALDTLRWTRQAGERIAHLSTYIRLCAWCRRIRDGDHWTPLEKFLRDQGSATSHGMCEDCSARLESDLLEAEPASAGDWRG